MKFTRYRNCLKVMVVVAMMCVVGSTSAYAATDDFSVTVGVMSWFNRYVPIVRLEGLDIPKSSDSFMNGPCINVRYRDLFLEVTYLFSSNDYELVSDVIPYGKSQAYVNSLASRKDIDAVIGWMVTPQIDVHFGYKGVFVNDDLTFTATRGVYYGKHRETYDLGVVGAGLHIPLGVKTMVLLNGNALLGAFDNSIAYRGRIELINDADRHSTAWGASTDAQITYAVIDTLSARIGLRYQFTKAGSDNSNFFGPTAGIDYRF